MPAARCRRYFDTPMDWRLICWVPALAPRGGMTVSSAACVGNDGHLVWTRQRAGDRPQLLLRGVAATADQGTSRRAGDAYLRGRSLLKRPLTRIMVGFPASKRGGPRARLSCIAQHLMLLWGRFQRLYSSARRAGDRATVTSGTGASSGAVDRPCLLLACRSQTPWSGRPSWSTSHYATFPGGHPLMGPASRPHPGGW